MLRLTPLGKNKHISKYPAAVAQPYLLEDLKHTSGSEIESNFKTNKGKQTSVHLSTWKEWEASLCSCPVQCPRKEKECLGLGGHQAKRDVKGGTEQLGLHKKPQQPGDPKHMGRPLDITEPGMMGGSIKPWDVGHHFTRPF